MIDIRYSLYLRYHRLNFVWFFKSLSNLSSKWQPILKIAIEKQYSKLISDYKVLLNRTKKISKSLNYHNFIRITAKMLEIPII